MFIHEFKSGACLDAHAADQILPYLTLAGGESLFTVSEIRKHTTTNIWVIGRFIDRSIGLEPHIAGTLIKIS